MVSGKKINDMKYFLDLIFFLVDIFLTSFLPFYLSLPAGRMHES